jgi:hypothetical protein
MDTLRKIVAGICATLFVISGVIALLAFNIESKAFRSTTYKQAFEKQSLYERMPEILANALYTSVSEDVNADSYLRSLTVTDWQAVITSFLPPGELRALADTTLDSVFEYLNHRSDSAVISLLPIKNNLTGAAGMEVVKQILRTQPDCTADQLLRLGLGLLGGDVALCNPPEELLGLMTPLIESQLQTLTVTFPDEITLISNAQNGNLTDPRADLDRVRAVMKITPFFPLFFLFGVSVFATRSLMDWLQWWGYPFLITGALSSLFALLGAPILGLIVQRVLQNQGAGLIPPIFLATMRETASVVTSQILKPVAIEGLILAALGLGMVIVALYLAKR